ncbi:Bsp6I family type II restriction endonuclease [Methylophilaceae bacterium]|nr:Bsp6I family type II restriction endonuclease [Methylophilaceae bacterium]
MKKINQSINIPEGCFNVDLDIFDQSDLIQLKNLYTQWNNLSSLLTSVGGRRLNLPEVISEGVVCVHFGAGRLNGGGSGFNSSWDCFQAKGNRRIQVKASSVKKDLTSFGPRSVWDDLYFVHFFPNGKYDGSYEIYKIPSEKIYSFRVNKNQTFKEQQQQEKRPRFSIIDGIIIPNAIQPLIRDSF